MMKRSDKKRGRRRSSVDSEQANQASQTAKDVKGELFHLRLSATDRHELSILSDHYGDSAAGVVRRLIHKEFAVLRPDPTPTPAYLRPKNVPLLPKTMPPHLEELAARYGLEYRPS